MDCPNGHGPMAQGAGFWVCLRCGAKQDAVAPLQGPLATLIPRVPHVLALTVEDFVREPMPYVKLHRLTVAAEILTRFCAAILLSDLLARHPAGFPEQVRRVLVHGLDRPTFGVWAHLARVAAEHPPHGHRNRPGCVVPELPGFVLRRLLPLLGSGGNPPESGIVPLRNVLAHSGRLSEADERRYLEAHPPRFEQLLLEADFLTRMEVIASPDGRNLFVLRGNPPAGQSFPPFDLARLPAGLPVPAPDRLLLLSGAVGVDLFPLHAYGPVFRYLRKAREDSWKQGHAHGSSEFFEKVAESAPLLYFRRGDQDYLEYTALSPHAAHSQEGAAAFERFRHVFALEEWRRLENVAAARQAFDFEELKGELRSGLVGRHEQLGRVVAWVKGAAGGLCWIHGHPGVGKSAFMAELSETPVFKDPRKFVSVVHFFRATDPRCNRMQFLANALGALFNALDRAEPLAANARERTQQFARLLQEFSAQELARLAHQRRKLLFLLDGLDEIAQSDSDFPDLFLAPPPFGVLWVCAGRDLGGLGERFRQHGAQVPFGEDGLPPLTGGDIRQMLDAECGALIYQLIARDRPDVASGTVENPFLSELIARSGGLPQYVRLLAHDLREGRVSFLPGDERKLPRGLGSYYERVLERTQVGDVAAVLTPVFCLLAVARAPLAAQTLWDLLSTDRTLRAGGEALLHRVLAAGHMLLVRMRIASDGAAADAFTLAHDSFRQHLLSSETVRISVAAAREDFRRCVVGWRGWTQRLFTRDYVVSHGPAHLSQGGWAHDWADLLGDAAFLQAKTAAGLGFELAMDLHEGYPAIARQPELADRVLHAVMRVLLVQHRDPQAGFTLDNLHSWLVYPHLEDEFYAALLQLGGSDTEGIGDGSAEERQRLRNKCRLYAANVERRRSNLRLASEQVRILLADLAQGTDLEERARVEYDAAYIHFLLDETDEAKALMGRSAEHAREADDPVGEWASRCVQARIAFLAGGLEPEAFRQVLHEALPVFETWIGDRRKGPLARRWALNAKAHLFEVALAESNLFKAERAFEAMRDDPWLLQHGQPEIMARARARLAALRGHWQAAQQDLEWALKLLPSDAPARMEGLAQDYLDLGDILHSQGQKHDAILAWQRGMECSDSLGNMVWKRRIAQRLDRVRGGS